MYPKEFSAVLAIGLVLICVYLLMTGKLTGWPFGFSLLASVVLVIGLHNIDTIGKVSISGGGVDAVMEIRELRNEVYAKVDELKKVAAGVGAFTVAGIVNENRWQDRSHSVTMLDRRDELDKFLREAGISDGQREAVILPITRMVDWDLRRAIVNEAAGTLPVPKGGDPTDQRTRNAFREHLSRLLQQPDRLKGLDEVEPLISWFYDPGNPLLRDTVAEYRRLLTTGRLPKVAPQDDLTKAPNALR